MQFEGALVLVPERAIFGQQLDRHFKDGGYGEDGLTINGHGGLNERAGFYQLPKRCTAPTDTVARFCVGLRSRGMRTLIATLGVFLAMATPAGAVQLVNPDGSVAQPYQSWLERSRMPAPPVTHIVVREDAIDVCGAVACTYEQGPIAIDRAWCEQSARSCRLALLHETGHQFDYSMPAWKREVFLKIVSRSGEAWRSGSANSPHETFAAAYSFVSAYSSAARALKARGFDPLSDDGQQIHYGFQLTKKTFGRIARLIRRANT